MRVLASRWPARQRRDGAAGTRKLCFEHSPDRQPMIVSVVTRGVSDDANAFAVDGQTAWLRVSPLLEKKGYETYNLSSNQL